MGIVSIVPVIFKVFLPQLGFMLFLLFVNVLVVFLQFRVLRVVCPDVVHVFFCCADILREKFAATVYLAFRVAVLVGADYEVR